MASAQAGSGPAGTAASHPYTCNTCQVAYRNIDLQKGHMKSDWHRYNLKRRVASLPPISSEVFTEKVLQARAVTSAEADKALFERLCEACNKTYYSENAYRNHLLSQKHKQALSAHRRTDDEATSVISSTFSLGEPAPVAQDPFDADVEDEFNQVIESLQDVNVSRQRPSPVKRPSNPRPPPADLDSSGHDEASTPTPTAGTDPAWTPESCLFCNYASPTAALNATHMERFHGMFVPEKAYLTDLDGLIKHLQRQVGQDHECLSCGKVKANVFAVQTHMRDKGHCMIPFSTEEEQLRIGDFYDFRSTYSDGGQDESDSDESDDQGRGAHLGSKRRAKLTGEDGQELDGDDGDGDGWETDSSVSSLDSADLTAVPAEGHIHQFERLSKHPHHSRHDAGHRHQVDGWHSRAHKHTHAVFHDDYELHLPSGKSVGHRSFNRYFRQNLANYPTPEERAERLALEAGDGGEGPRRQGDGAPGGREVAGRGSRGRAVLPRGAEGMMGVSDAQKRTAQTAVRRGRDAEMRRVEANAWSYGKRANNQKTYYYRYDGGG